jgi:hypothetical protein
MKARIGGQAAAIVLLLAAAAAADVIVTFPDPNLEAAVREALGIGWPTPITDTDMVKLTLLEKQQAGISDLTGLQYATNLRRMDFSSNQITDLMPLSGLTKMLWIQIGDNDVEDLGPLAGLPLSCLFASANRIRDLSSFAGLTHGFLSLDLSHNEIGDIGPLAGLPGVVSLSLGYNRIADISPLASQHYQYLGLRGNPLNAEAYEVYIPRIQANNPEADIRYDPIPEPGAIALVLCGAGAMLCLPTGIAWWTFLRRKVRSLPVGR